MTAAEPTCAVDLCELPATWLVGNYPCQCTTNIPLCTDHERHAETALDVFTTLRCTTCHTPITGTTTRPIP